MDYIQIKRLALSKYFSNLNEKQREAVFTVDGPVLILAGAGSGKTTVLVNRIANMIYFGNAYYDESICSVLSTEDELYLHEYIAGRKFDNEILRDIIVPSNIRDDFCVKPWNILAITFTNKAAGELKDRLERMLGEKGSGVMAATFHSCCARILRREIEKLGYASNFTIYDTDDSLRVVKSCLSDLNISDKHFPPKSIAAEISHSKEAEVYPDEYENLASGDYRKLTMAKVYRLYQQKLKSANAVDFDDIILLTVELFEKFPEVLEHYQNLYKYILVDEYQDTNMVQFKLVWLLSQRRGNLCVVGDDDQSIYKFRGATIENILSFEKQFEQSKVIRLEQNYRSTQNILTSANEVIKNNRGRKGKNLWTSSGDGEKVVVYKAESELGEAKFVAETILKAVQSGGRYCDNAVLYRMNAQSNAIERALVASGISYRVIGGVKFYDRKEVKDILAYLAVINNETDVVRLRRIINEPKRGIGDASVNALLDISNGIGESPLNVMRNAASYPSLSRSSTKLTELAGIFDNLAVLSEAVPLPDLLDELMKLTGYETFLKMQGEEGQTRLENIEELKSSMLEYSKNAVEPTLQGFLEEIALYTDVDDMNSDEDKVTLMTVHSAKGLEFENVFVVGLEENIFPSSRSIFEEEEIEEERRLAYVAITRAKKRLYLSCSAQRMLFGNTSYNRPSRFIAELPKETVSEQSEASHRPAPKQAPRQSASQTPFMSQLGAIKAKAQAPKQAQTFAVGQQVKHNVFGLGIVLSATPMSNDTMLEIAFDKVGTKKIMANFAKIQKV